MGLGGRRSEILGALLIVGFAIMATVSARHMSITGDEVTHLPAGYSYVATGDYRMNPQHPPLMKYLAGVPLSWMQLDSPRSHPGWRETREWAFGKAVLARSGERLADVVFCGRLPMVAVATLLALVLLVWATELWGANAALFVGLVYATSPNFLAHGAIVHTDAGLAAFGTLTIYWLWKFGRSGSLAYTVGAGVALGLCLLAKYSGLVFAGLVPMILCGFVWNGSVSRRRAMVAGVLILLIGGTLVQVLFEYPHGLGSYWHGVGLIHADANSHWRGFLWGDYSADGFYSYYLLAQLWKTPLPVLIAAMAATVACLRRPSNGSHWWILLLPIFAFHAAGAWQRASIGVRHILPAFPFLFLLSGGFARWCLDGSLMRRGVLIALCVWQVAGTVRMAPHFLPFFNELAGGPNDGIAYLDDSNIEWGQAYYDVVSYLEREQPDKVKMFAFEPIDRSHYGIDAPTARLEDAVLPEPGTTYLIGASYLQRSSLFPRREGVRFEWLERYEPIERIGWSIYSYRFSTDPADQGDREVVYVRRDQWYSDAIEQLERMLARHPDFEYAEKVLEDVRARRRAEFGSK